ncbi:MAG: hypothetical protein GXY03_10020 [Solirubrobacterales bacterium]|nr:hypothetical protein [Solirubrobacterales bacterium]
MEEPPRKYFSERHGRGPTAEPVSFETLRRLVISALDSLREQGYMQEAFGIECVDGDSDGTLGSDPDAYFLRVIMREGVWPYWRSGQEFRPRGAPPEASQAPFESWDLDTLFDVVEVMHDLISKPIEGRYHSFNECGWHYQTFDKIEGQQVFRNEMNRVLRLADPPFELNEEGHLVERAPTEFRQLLEAPVPPGTEHDLITSRIDAATTRFRARGASLDDRRHAVRDLADVLEALRRDMKNVMLSKDESELFNIANNFAIRHNNRQQRGDYDRLIWLRWAFYVYLATIHAVLRVRARERAR